MGLSPQFYELAVDKAKAHLKVTAPSDDKWLLSAALLQAEAALKAREKEGKK